MNGMTNIEIICNELVNHKIYTENELTTMLEKGIDIPCHTYNEWKKLGYQVKKGEKASIATRLWKHNDKKEPKYDKDGKEIEQRDFYLNYAYLFLASQVEKQGEEKQEKKVEEPKKVEVKETQKAVDVKKSIIKSAKAKAKYYDKKAKKTTRKANVNDKEELTLKTTPYQKTTEDKQIVNMIKFEAVNKLGEVKRYIEMKLDDYVNRSKKVDNFLKTKWGVE